jgi:hypothetical protein
LRVPNTFFELLPLLLAMATRPSRFWWRSAFLDFSMSACGSYFRIIPNIILDIVFGHVMLFGEASSQSNAAVGRQWHPAYQTAGRGFRHVAPEQRPSHGS